jgi:hypothetical protein
LSEPADCEHAGRLVANRNQSLRVAVCFAAAELGPESDLEERQTGDSNPGTLSDCRRFHAGEICSADA